jgi:hypothetical protein
MSEWIDFCIYATQVILFWVLVPRQARGLGLPTIADRNPAWLAAHPEVADYFDRNTNFLRVWYAWAAVSIAVLVALLLGWRPLWLAESTAPLWAILKNAQTLLLFAGMLGWFASAALWWWWLKRNVPPADTRTATLQPRTTGSYLSLKWRVIVETLTALHVAAWLVFAAVQDALPADYWRRFVAMVTLTLFFAGFAWLVPRRRPGYPDRLFGETYRRVEMRVAYLARLAPFIVTAIALDERFAGQDFTRQAHLLLALFVGALVGVFLLLRPVSRGGTPPRQRRDKPGGEMIGTSFASTIRGTIQESRAS